MYGIYSDLLISALRHVLMFIGGLLVYKGYVSADAMGLITGAIVSAVSAGFATFFHATSNGTIPTISTTSNALPSIRDVPTNVG